MASTSASGSKGKEKVMDAFDELAPSPHIPASIPMKRPSYHVFINHHGQDVKSTVASVLYGMLTERQLSVFLDKPELEYGDYFPQTIQAAMSSALVHISIFSQRYTESTWCLAELSFMLKTGATIIPVFYHVDPSDLRRVDQGKYVNAFQKHKQEGRYSLEKLEAWKKALHQVSFYTGQKIEAEEDENRQLKDTVDIVLKKINEPLKVADHPVGMKEIVEDFERSSTHSDEGVQIIGIWGMGGAGKTTLAKELYNRRSSSIGRSSFVYSVRDASNNGLLCEMQKKILRDFDVQDLRFHNIVEGKRTLSNHLRSARVLLVLDDVDHVDQFDALLPEKDRLATGSLIIITTREYDVLKSWGITSVYKMKALEQLYAQQLFCWHAFKQPIPMDGFQVLVRQLLEACHGLPLALKVIGAQVFGEYSKECWESLLDKITRILSIDIQRILKISYDTLDDEEKEMFLDAACFFIDENCTLLIEVWNGLGRSGVHTWKRLLNKCLVECDEYNYIRIHDHIRDLGREIAGKQSPCRFWLGQPLIKLQNQKEKSISIQGIKASSIQIMWGDYMKEEERLPETVGKTGEDDESRVSCMDGKLMVKTNGGIWQLSPSLVGLKYLITSGNSFCEVMVEVSRELVWLRWFQIGQRNLPSGLSLKNLRVLELYEKNDMFFKKAEHHLEKLWGETEGEAPVQLRELIISHCRNFQGFPKSIGHLKHLKKIVIIASWNVRSLPNEFCLLQSLEHLVCHCPLLSLPNNFGNLSNLRHLNLADCSFERLPVSFKNLMLLEYLNLEFCSLLEFTSEDLNFMENMTKLEFLSLSGCEELEDLPRHITTQASLRELYFSDTSLRELPNNIGQLSKMRKMDVTVMSTSLPTSFGGLSSLTQLAIKSCPKLERLPDFFGGLPSLTILSIEDCSKLEGLPDSFGDLSSLTNLDIKRCPQLEILPKSIGQLNNLLKLSICSCPISELNFGTASLTFGPSKVKDIQLIETKVCMISFSEDCCPHLKSLSISDNHHLKEIEALPRNLESITLKDCEMLKNIPSFAQLTSLRKFQLFGCYGIEKIEGIENCTGLTELRVDTCWEVPGIESLEHMQNLKELEFRANKGSVIERCIQTIQKWPDETITIFTRALPQAASVLVSLVSPNLVIANSISNQKITSHPQLVMKRSSNCEAFILCVVTNCLSSQMTMYIDNGWSRPSVIKLEKGRWAWVGISIQRSHHKAFTAEEFRIGYENGGEEDKVEQGLVMSGEEQTVMVAFRSLLPDDGYRTSFE